jgi:rare lipoprotein A (peptidoglycan hydrolase)
MPIKSKTARCLLALVASGACAALPASALALTGGASAPGMTRPAHKARVHVNSVATWFGPGFYGKRTACGQTLTPSIVGVAHRTLPCGTLVKVSYNGRVLIVPVLDRGPYSPIASWDLTSGAAEALGVTQTVRIGTRIVGSAPNSPALGAPVVPPPSPTPSVPLAGGAVAG